MNDAWKKSRSTWITSLQEAVEFERVNGKLMTVSRYRPFSPSAMNLNVNEGLPTVFDVLVDPDWMFCVAWGSYQTRYGPGLVYFGGKCVRNIGILLERFLNVPRSFNLKEVLNYLMTIGRFPYDHIYSIAFDEANRSAPYVADKWLYGGYTLAEIFAPALRPA